MTLDPISKVMHFNMADPKDLAHLAQASWFWTSAGPQAAQAAITAIAEGDAPYNAAAVPEWALKAINELRNQLGKPPLGDAPESPAPEEPNDVPGAGSGTAAASPVEPETPVEEAAPTEEPEVPSGNPA